MISLISGLLPLVKVRKEQGTLTEVTIGPCSIVAIWSSICPVGTPSRAPARLCGNRLQVEVQSMNKLQDLQIRTKSKPNYFNYNIFIAFKSDFIFFLMKDLWVSCSIHFWKVINTNFELIMIKQHIMVATYSLHSIMSLNLKNECFMSLHQFIFGRQ